MLLINIMKLLSIGSDEKEFTFKVFSGEEKDFFQLHEFIIKKQNNKFSFLQSQPNYSKWPSPSKPPPSVDADVIEFYWKFSGIVVIFKMLHGELSQVREENPILFKNISLTKKLGFPDIILPGDVRNDLYVTLDKGEFERGGKSTSKNIEVAVVVLDGSGNILEVSIWLSEPFCGFVVAIGRLRQNIFA